MSLVQIYRRVTALADQAKDVRARDLVAIAHECDSAWGVVRLLRGVGAAAESPVA